MQLTPQLKDILEAAVLAPSADNHHRLSFEPTTDGVLVWYEPGRFAALTGYKRTLDLVSLGTVIENIALRSSAHGLMACIELFPRETADLVARIEFQPTSSEADPLNAAIPIRHTNRRIFTGPTENPATLQRIAEEARKIPGCTLDWLDSPELRTKALRLIRLAEGERFRSQALHAEMFETIRFKLGWNQSCDEALPPGALEIDALSRPFFQLMRHWSFMRIFNVAGGHKLLGYRAGDLPCRFSPHLGVIGVSTLADHEQINAGRAFERVWLAITQHGLALQPMPASVLYAQQAAPEGGVDSALQAHLRQGWKELLPDNTPLMVFRTGRATAPSVVTVRRSVESYLRR